MEQAERIISFRPIASQRSTELTSVEQKEEGESRKAGIQSLLKPQHVSFGRFLLHVAKRTISDCTTEAPREVSVQYQIATAGRTKLYNYLS